MPRSKKRTDVLPEEFGTVEEAAKFWDTHDLADFWEETQEASAKIRVPPTPRYVPLDKEIAESIAEVAQRRRISMETLVNRWLKERVSENPGV